ncbi:MAG: signal peptidase I [Clostridiales bacterium]|nr:signal peptidase I [Clostridiales bacterium]
MESHHRKEPQTLRRRREVERKRDRRKEIFSWIRMFAIAIAAVLVITRFIIINANVPSGSMETTIMTNDRLIGFRFSYWFDDPERGDIILFHYPVDESVIYIKRVIGLPGETVEIRNGQVYINGSDTPLEEDYLPEEWYQANDGYYFEIPEDCYFVLGDNRNNSADSRYWAEEAIEAGVVSSEEEAIQYSYVKRDQILGKAIFTYYSSFRNLTNTADYLTE